MIQPSASSHELKENVRKYWNERSSSFDLDIGHGADETECRLWKENLGGIIGTKPGKILDVGTGTGMIAINLAELGHEVTGIDLGEEMLKKAEAKAAERGLCISFLQGDAEEPDFPDNSFDAVICRHLLWTLPHPDKAIREWARICRPGGVIVAIDGHAQPHNYFSYDDRNDEKLSERERLWREMYSPELIQVLPYKENLTVETLKNLFSSLGLTDVQSRRCDDISRYQKGLVPAGDPEGDHCEVQIIWGRVP